MLRSWKVVHVVDKKQAYIIVRHAKFTTKKSGKKAIKALNAASIDQNAVQSKSVVDNIIQEGMAPQAAEWEPSEKLRAKSSLTI